MNMKSCCRKFLATILIIEVIRYRGVCLLGKGYFHEAFHYATLAEGFALVEKTMTEKRQKKMTQFAD
jgi:hypothetical protein